MSEFNLMRSAPEATRPKFIIFKITDDNQRIVVEESSSEKTYNTFIAKLWYAGNPYQSAPRYAVYDMEYELSHEGKRYESTH
jgi:cofilin